MNGRARGALGLASALLIALIATAAWKASAIRVALSLRKLESRDLSTRHTAAAELWAIGSAGISALESVAFSRDLDPSRLPVRQSAFNELWFHEPPQDSLPDDRLARYAVDGLGLERGSILDAACTRLHWGSRQASRAFWLAGIRASQALWLAALTELFYEEPDDDVALTLFRSVEMWKRLPLLRRRLLDARSTAGRFESVRALSNLTAIGDPENRALFRRALGDPKEAVRIEGAWALADHYNDPSGLEILIAGVRAAARRGSTAGAAVAGLDVLGDPRCVEAFVRVFEDAGVAEGARSSARSGLERELGGAPPAEAWRSLWEARRADFPPQLDPEKVPVGPVR